MGWGSEYRPKEGQPYNNVVRRCPWCLAMVDKNTWREPKPDGTYWPVCPGCGAALDPQLWEQPPKPLE